MTWLRGAVVGMAILALAPVSDAQVVAKKELTLEGARQIIAAATMEARRDNVGGTIAVVDEGGNLIAVERLDGTFAASGNISIGKARTAAIFKRPTKAFEEIIRGGRTPMIALSDFTPLQGGVPIMLDGQVIGAIGVSGAASAQRDEEIAQAGANAARAFGQQAAVNRAATHLDSRQVAAAFARGVPLLEADGYKVHASRRDGPGVAEVHDWETDVVYVLDGGATLVTGGSVVDPKVTEAGQIRGPAIQGGQSRRIAKGDVIVIPAGVPHWFKEVQGPLTYFVVKPISMNGGGR